MMMMMLCCVAGSIVYKTVISTLFCAEIAKYKSNEMENHLNFRKGNWATDKKHKLSLFLDMFTYWHLCFVEA